MMGIHINLTLFSYLSSQFTSVMIILYSFLYDHMCLTKEGVEKSGSKPLSLCSIDTVILIFYSVYLLYI